MYVSNKDWLLKRSSEGLCRFEIARLCNVDPTTVRYWERKHNIKLLDGRHKQKYLYNESFFKTIDTEIKAYTLGFIAADGHIRSKPQLVIKLNPKDETILVDIKRALEYTGPLIREGTKSIALIIYSPSIVEDLAKLGILRNKTNNLLLPLDRMEQSLHRHLLRGLFDGDGHIGNGSTSLCASNESLKDQLLDLIRSRFKEVPTVRYGNNCYKLNLCRRHHEFLKWIYEESTIALNRKLDTYEKYWREYIPNSRARARG